MRMVRILRQGGWKYAFEFSKGKTPILKIILFS